MANEARPEVDPELDAASLELLDATYTIIASCPLPTGAPLDALCKIAYGVIPAGVFAALLAVLLKFGCAHMDSNHNFTVTGKRPTRELLMRVLNEAREISTAGIPNDLSGLEIN